MKNVILLIMLCGLFFGCASSRVQTSTTTFYKPGYNTAGKIAVIAADNSVNDSLEFGFYKSEFEKKLAKSGYVVVESPDRADYVALVAYGIDEGKTSTVTTPIFGQTGGGTSYTSGTVSTEGVSTNYSESTYSMPTYGVVGSSTGNVTRYTRAIALDIVSTSSARRGEPEKILELRAKSSGTCSQIAGVFNEILEGMFKGFPRKNGSTKTEKVTFRGDC